MNISPLAMGAPPTTPQKAASTSGTSSNSGATLNAGNAQSTFLNMLVAELQNQDPTQPMDPSQLVGQMFSMNQLQQLIDINQTLQGMTGTTNGTGSATPAATTQAIQGAH